MTIRSRAEAVKAADARTSNVPNTCQLVTREYFNAPSAGDRDHDGDADAVDGWLSEPQSHRHTDRHPPAGVPVAYGGGSSGNGHRAISLGNGMIRSTDAPHGGVTSTVSLDWPERQWGLRYLGWSDTIDGELIPGAPAHVTAPTKHHAPTRGKVVDQLLEDIKHAKGDGERGRRIARARLELDAIGYLK